MSLWRVSLNFIPRKGNDVKESETITLMAAAKETLERHWKGTKNEMTAWNNARDVFERMGRDVPVNTVDEHLIDRLVADLEADGKKPATINRKLSALSKILRHSLRLGYVSRMPLIERRKEPHGRMRWLSDEEELVVVRLFRQTSLEMSRFVEALVDTGMRFSELFELEWRDVDFERSVVHLWETKNGRPRTIPLTRRAVASLKGQVGGGFLRVWGFTKYQFRHAWDGVRKEMGMTDDKQFVPHALRHTCASRLVQRGIDLRIVQEFLGHSNINTTLRYAHLAPKNLEQARDALEVDRKTLSA